jgi:hypothetical protein
MEEAVIEIMLCERCHVGHYPEGLSGMLIRPHGCGEPHTEGPYCEDCVALRRAEAVEYPAVVLRVERLRRVRGEETTAR